MRFPKAAACCIVPKERALAAATRDSNRIFARATRLHLGELLKNRVPSMLNACGNPIGRDAASTFGNIGEVLIERTGGSFASTIFDVALEGRV
jgi:hypothetical protein